MKGRGLGINSKKKEKKVNEYKIMVSDQMLIDE
jgi:hypothetical protein